MDKVYKNMIIGFAFLIFSTVTNAVEKERIVKKSFKVDSDTELKIKNSFGKIDIESYEGNEIFIEVTIWAKGSSDKKVEKFVNSINIEFDESSREIEVETSSISNNNKVKKFEVNYVVKMPSKNKLSIDNSFGNVYIGDHSGRVELDMSHGNFKAGIIENKDNEIELNFGNGEIKKYSAGKIDLAHSNLNIGDVDELKLESEFSNTDVKRVKSSISAQVSHGGLSVTNMERGFDDVEIEAEFSKLNIDFGNIPFNLNYYGSFSTITKPSKFELILKDKDYTSEEIKGKVNGGGNEVTIKASHSTVKLN